MSVLRCEGIVKDYPGTRALQGVSLCFESGKVNALLGKNGSGKSTLVKIIAGAEQATEGRVYLDEQPLAFKNPAEANRQGIVMVYQELSLVPSLSVAENIYLGNMPKKNGVIRWKRAFEDARTQLRAMNVDLDPRTQVQHLMVWQQQVVEICKAMALDPRVLILDEPTSSLSQSEVQCLFRVVDAIRKRGVIVIYITHKLQELAEIADTVSVLRDGQYVGSDALVHLSSAQIVHMMFGDVAIRERPSALRPSSGVAMQVRGLSRQGWYEDVSFTVHKGEVLGIAGMLGSGRSELLRGIFGADPVTSGEVVVDGKHYGPKKTPKMMKDAGLGLTPENRKHDGLILQHSVQDNLCYASMDKTCRGFIEDRRKRREFGRRQVEGLQIRVASLSTKVRALSGGNQQKVVVGNWLNNDPSIMMYDEPSRGIDVAAKQQIFEVIWKVAEQGCSSIFVSSELEELLEVCHRILIMFHGRIVAEVLPERTTVNALYEACMRGRLDDNA